MDVWRCAAGDVQHHRDDHPDLLTIVTITDGQTTAIPGATVVYTVTVSNAGPSAASGAVLSFPISALLLNPTFTSTAAGGASGNTASGSGNLTEVLNLPVGSTVTYTVTGKINPSATGSLTNTVTVTAPVTAPDLSGGIHTASDTDALTAQADLKVVTARVGNAPAPGGKLVYSLPCRTSAERLEVGAVHRHTADERGVRIRGANLRPGVHPEQPGSRGDGRRDGHDRHPAGRFIRDVHHHDEGVRGGRHGGAELGHGCGHDHRPRDANNSSTAATSIGSPTTPSRIVVGTGNGGGPEVQVYDASNGALLMDFFAYEDTFRGGVNVAQGDVNGDGVPDIIAGSGVGGGPVVKVFDGVTGNLIRSFLAYEPTFRGGVNVSTGDINGDGFADIFCGSAWAAARPSACSTARRAG